MFWCQCSIENKIENVYAIFSMKQQPAKNCKVACFPECYSLWQREKNLAINYCDFAAGCTGFEIILDIGAAPIIHAVYFVLQPYGFDFILELESLAWLELINFNYWNSKTIWQSSIYFITLISILNVHRKVRFLEQIYRVAITSDLFMYQ